MGPLSAALVAAALAATPPGPAVAAAPDDAAGPAVRPAEAPTAATVPAGEVTGPPERPGISWFAFPVLFWLPETRLGGGAASGLHFRLEGARRASSVFAVGAYTLNRQGSADLAADVYLRDGTLLAGRLRAVHFPDRFHGVGPRSRDASGEDYTRRWLQGIISAEPAFLGGRLRVGPRLDLRAEHMQDLKPGGLLASGAYTGARGFSAVGVGGSVTWDTRERPLFPTRGAFLQLWAIHYPVGLGNQAEFSVANLEGRWFQPLGGERVLGFAAYAEQDLGDPPFTLLPKLGSSQFLRGWREGRFRDRAAWSAQTELRVPLFWRFTGTAFAAVGDVAHDLGAFHLDTLKLAGGLGVRFRLTPEGANLRLDVAESRAGPTAYFLLLDAF